MQSGELHRCFKTRKMPAVIDVRTGFEFRSGHIPGAIHAPTWKILLRLVQIPTDKSAELVITCEHGPRAQIVKRILGAFGYTNVTLLSGHMAGWRQAGYPQEK